MLSRVHPSPSTSGRSLGAVVSAKMGQDHRERPFETYFNVFSSFLGFILPQTDQKCTFYTIFSSKLPSGRYEASSYWNFAPRSILSPRMSSDPKKRHSVIKLHLFSSFLGFILPKSDQKCTFQANFHKFGVLKRQYGDFTTLKKNFPPFSMSHSKFSSEMDDFFLNLFSVTIATWL